MARPRRYDRLAHECPRCGAAAGARCFDLRRGGVTDLTRKDTPCPQRPPALLDTKEKPRC